MVKIAVAGGTSSVGREIIDVLAATKKHEILILSRNSSASDKEARHNVSYAVTDYSSVEELSTILHGYDTVLSFVAHFVDRSETVLAQKRLIDASIKAGVKRFAPSEWVSARSDHMPWYHFKAETRQYLEKINKDSKVLEYCLFQPGLFTNYLLYPYRTMTHVPDFHTPLDFNSRRMIVCDGGEDRRVSFTTVRDLANVVALAVEYNGEWPVVGGMKGGDLSVSELVALGEELRGPINVTRVDVKSLQNREFDSPWLPTVAHPSMAPEVAEAAAKELTAGFLLGMDAGAFESNDAWNVLLPDYKFEDAESFLRKGWEGKP